MATNKVAALERTALFGGLETGELQALAELTVERRLSRNEILFVAGEAAQGLYVVVEGSVRAFRENPEGREQIIHVETAGATLAEIPAFDNGPYPSTVAADEESVLLFIDKRDVRRLCLERPQIALAALKLLAGRMRRCAALVEQLSLRDVGQRLARFLLAEARNAGVRDAAGLHLSLAETNQQIASRVGSVREVVSRTLTRLQQVGLVRIEGRHLTILDEEGLASYAGEET